MPGVVVEVYGKMRKMATKRSLVDVEFVSPFACDLFPSANVMKFFPFVRMYVLYNIMCCRYCVLCD